ncbi:MAG: VOC family protein [Phycisphaerales bacterium]
MAATKTGLSIGTVLLRVSDLDRACAFYGGVLGLTETGRVEGAFVFYDAGSVTLALHRVNSEPSDPRSLHALSEVSFETADIQREFARLRGSGVEFLCGEKPMLASSDATHDLYAAPFRDPDGHILSLTSRVARG